MNLYRRAFLEKRIVAQMVRDFTSQEIVSVLTRTWHWTHSLANRNQSTNSLRHILIFSSHSCLGLIHIFRQYLDKIK
jgi:hypothetical protein